jgi:uncharacterized phiE125 gp8 family phage protein
MYGYGYNLGLLGRSRWDAQHRQDRALTQRNLSRGEPPHITVAPTDSPVTLDEVKLATRITGNDEDSLLQTYLDSAIEAVQLDAEIALCTQTRVQYLDDFPDGQIELRMPPIQSVTSVTYYDYNSTQQTMSSTLYDTDLTSRPGIIVPTYAQIIWPIALPKTNTVAVTFVCGYTSPSLVPPTAKHAIYLRVAASYWMREMQGADEDRYWNLIRRLRWREF